MKRFTIAALTVISLFFAVSCGTTDKVAVPPVEDTVQDAPVEKEEPKDESGKSQGVQDFSEQNKALLSKVDEARQSAIDAGAREACPNAFAGLDDEYNKLKEAVADGKDHSSELNALSEKYLSLKAYCDALAKKKRVDELDFAKYNEPKYSEGCSLLEELEDSEVDEDWYKKAVRADKDFTDVLKAGFAALAKEERKAAFNAKKNADSVKAAVSRKDEYNRHTESFKSGDSNFVTGDPETAYGKYKSAKEGFTSLYESIAEARARAQKAVEEARNRVSASESVAIEADELKPIGDDEKLEGIEDEDTVLLEQDDFSVQDSVSSEAESQIQEDIEISEDEEDAE